MTENLDNAQTIDLRTRADCLFHLLWVYYESSLNAPKRTFRKVVNNYRSCNIFPNNQTSNSGNLTRLDCHVALMNGKDLAE